METTKYLLDTISVFPCPDGGMLISLGCEEEGGVQIGPDGMVTDEDIQNV
jgi:hypothetical protein